MKSSFISSSAIQNAMRLTIRQSQNQMVKSAVEASTKMYADVGVALGVDTAKSVNFNREIDRIKSIKDSNSTVSFRLEMSQTGLDAMLKAGDSLVANLTALKGSQTPDNVTVTLQQAASAFSQLMDTANSVQNGEYLFSGINTDVPPLTDKSAATAAQIQADLTTFRTTVLAPPKAVNELTAADMETFMTTYVEPKFTTAAWTDPVTGWSKASSQNMSSRISNSEVITSSTNANADGMRYFAMATVMTQALAGQDLNSGAMGAVSMKAISVTSQAVAGITSQKSQLGLSEERLSKANDALDAQSNIIQNKLIDLTGVDPVEATTIVKNMETQLQTSYTIISKIQQLSLVNYL